MDERGPNDVATVANATPRAGRRRRVLAGLALMLACVSILLSTVAVWTHQVAFNTERFTALTSRVVTSPEIIDPLSARISTQVVDALGVGTRLEARLPDALKPLAGALTVAVRDGIERRLQVALANPKIQNALITTLSFAHARIMALLRGQSNAVTVVDGYVVIQVFPVVGAALTELQAMGLIPPEVQLPDLSSGEPPEVLLPRLQTALAALGVTLPADFGTIQLMPADRLVTAQAAVRAFDIIVVVLLILSVVLVALAIWLARHRRRMVIYVAIGTIIAFLLARLAIRGIEEALIAGIADAGVASAVRSVLDATIEDLRRLTTIILVATAIVAIVAYLWGRPQWAVAVASRAGDLAGRAGTSAAAAGSAGIGAAASRRPTRAALDQTVRDNRALVERVGLVAIAFILLWLAIGLEVALLGLALVVGWELVVRALATPPDEDGPAPAADGQPASD